MSTILVQNAVGSITLFLQNAALAPVTGLTFADVTVDLQKAGAGSFSNKVLTAPDFVELDGGFYTLNLSATETDTLGNLNIRVSGATISTYHTTAYIAANAVTVPPVSLSIPQTTIYGYVYDPAGNPVSGASVSAKILNIPTILQATEGVLLVTKSVVTKTDTSGYFSLDLVTGATVAIAIPSANYRRNLQVPASDSNLFELP